MEIDKVTYQDLSIFQAEEDSASVFEKLNFTRTNGGRDQLQTIFLQPFSDLAAIKATQQVLQLIQHKKADWPLTITNGTVMVMEKFYATSVDSIPAHPNFFSARSYQIFHNSDFSLIKFSVTHFADFFRGLSQMTKAFLTPEAPAVLQVKLQRMQSLLVNHRQLQAMINQPAGKAFSAREVLEYAYFLKGRFKHECFELIDTYSLLDAWYSMAMAVEKYRLCYPEMLVQDKPFIEGNQLYHLLLPVPVSYDVRMDEAHNFHFLTGANMAGKSTYIKTVGIAVYLAHLGMGVPATKMRLSLFDGLLSNIQVVDNISKGESYFFNEVQRIKNTVLKIHDGKKWLVLIDELFKGTNVQDAMKCSLAVIRGLIRIRQSLFILSTHLYEIGEELKTYPNIQFSYFETFVDNEQLSFSYVLKPGISNDRLGYLILKREGVVEMLEGL
jgi:DNA mismatch repair protein MutS